MRKSSVVIASAAVGLWASSARADIPVVDFAGIGNQLRQIAQEAKAYAVQGQQYLTEAKTLYTEAQMLIGFVHDPNLGAVVGLMNAAGLGNSLPVNPYAVQGLINGVNYRPGGIPNVGGILGNLSNLANSSWSANHLYTPQSGSWISKEVVSAANGISGTQGAAESAYGDYRNHMGIIQALRDRLAVANNPKDVMDAQGQIAAETLWTNSLQGQMTAIQVAYETQRDNREQREREHVMQAGESYLASARAAGVIQ